jgi:hypothetical protein
MDMESSVCSMTQVFESFDSAFHVPLKSGFPLIVGCSATEGVTAKQR